MQLLRDVVTAFLFCSNKAKAFTYQISFPPTVLCKSKRRVVYITARLSV